ncbi:AMP-binding protein [Photorhabdus luminescens]|uniref:2,3-dihydroxybenzoate-AMP ligase n=1 Tax=Photorhabdus luminescens subsp. mexicana TaxID=2100167 RepID=A0A4R4IXC0_PHOLU|nr:AMP-binding protein [Photorhabdus luminescens]TDB45608.1 2,3-dihydroxybenzoate-AMP ligase [Photorhabdus luminescens subsp. mexicana]
MKDFSQYRKLGCLGYNSMTDWFAELVDKYRTRIALVSKTREFTYDQLWLESRCLASTLRESGLERHDICVLQTDNNDEFVLSLLALLIIGVKPVLALPTNRHAEIIHFVKVSKATSVIFSTSIGGKEHLKVIRNVLSSEPNIRRVFTFGKCENATDISHFSSQPYKLEQFDPDATAFYLLSGGTTGLSKLIPRRHAEYIYNIQLAANNAEMAQNSTYLVTLPMAHNYALGCPGIFGVFSKGGKVILSKDPSPDTSLDLISQHAVTHIALVPPLAHHWVNAVSRYTGNLTSLEVVQVGGAKVSLELAQAIMNRFPNTLQQSYGMGEGFLSQTHRKDPESVKLQTQGKPLSMYDQYRVVDKNGQIIHTRPAQGILEVNGPYTIGAYFNAPEANRESFTDDGFYRTGDVVQINLDGTLTVIGRSNDVINKGGEKVGPDELEELLIRFPGAKEVAVFAIEDHIMGHRIGVAMVAEGKVSLPKIKTFLREQGIAEYKLPDKFKLVNELPKTPVGKLDRKAIKQDYLK